MKLFFKPVKPGWKLRARFTVRLFTEPLVEEAPAFSVHWLFCSVPGWPMVKGPSQLLPSSLIRYKLPLAAMYMVPQAPGQLSVVLSMV